MLLLRRLLYAYLARVVWERVLRGFFSRELRSKEKGVYIGKVLQKGGKGEALLQTSRSRRCCSSFRGERSSAGNAVRT